MSDETETDDDVNTNPEWGPVFHKSGGIQFHLDGELETIRVPKIGQLKRLKDAHHDANDAVNRSQRAAHKTLDALMNDLNDARQKLLDIKTRAESAPDDETLLTAQSDANRLVEEITETLEDQATATRRAHEAVSMEQATGWFIQTFNEFGIVGVTDPDELPAWCARMGTIRQFVEHWMTYPSPRGV